MLTLIRNETCFAVKIVHVRLCIARIMVKTRRGSFRYVQTKHVKNCTQGWRGSKYPKGLTIIGIELQNDYNSDLDCIDLDLKT